MSTVSPLDARVTPALPTVPGCPNETLGKGKGEEGRLANHEAGHSDNRQNTITNYIRELSKELKKSIEEKSDVKKASPKGPCCSFEL